MGCFIRFFLCLFLALAPYGFSWSGDGFQIVPREALAGKKALVGSYIAGKLLKNGVQSCAKSGKCRSEVAASAAKLGKKVLGNQNVKNKASQVANALFPELKLGTRGGPKAGKSFGKPVKDEAFARDPSKTCVFCERPGTGSQVDHAYPRSRGGDAEIGNAQLACKHCNPSKGNGIIPKSPPPGYKGKWPTDRLLKYEAKVKKARGWK